MSRKPSPRKKTTRGKSSRRETASAARRLTRGLLGAVATFVAVGVLAVLAALWIYQGPGPAAPAGETTTVVLRKGSSLPEIASSLQKGGVIGSSSVFMTAAKLTGAARSLKAGEYEFKSRASMASILDAIRHGRIVRHWITVPEGLTSDMVMDILNKSDVLTGEAATPPEGSIATAKACSFLQMTASFRTESQVQNSNSQKPTGCRLKVCRMKPPCPLYRTASS